MDRKWTECIGLYQTESYLYCPSIRTCSVLIRDDVHVLLDFHLLGSVQVHVDLDLQVPTHGLEPPRHWSVQVHAAREDLEERLEQAAARLGTVMQQGSPEKMFAKIQELAIINQIDAPLVELLDANRQQALEIQVPF